MVFENGRLHGMQTFWSLSVLELYPLQALEELVDEGLLKAIGVSNFTIEQMERIRMCSKHPLSNAQIELHLYFQQEPLVAYCRKHNISVTAYAPLGSPGRENSEHM